MTANSTIDHSNTNNPNRARDHLANERTFLAWVRTGLAIIVFGFAIGRFGLALRQFFAMQGGKAPQSTGMSVWLGLVSMVAGMVMVVTGLVRYHITRTQLDDGTFEPAGWVIDLTAILATLMSLALVGYLFLVENRLH
jgi:putative membrane protein